MVTIHLKGRVTEDGDLVFDPPKNLPPGEVQITIEMPAETAQPLEQDFTDEEIKEFLTFKPKTGKEIVEEGLIGGWEDTGITDSVEWVEEQRRKERERRHFLAGEIGVT
jgi:hypothetical protein